MIRRLLVLACATVLVLPAQAQQIHTYTESQGGANNLPLGYPVPIPVASLEPVDGFRDYASLEARLQGLALASDDLSAHQVGTTQQYARPVWAYRASDADASDWEGGTEAAFFINAGIHAREWGTQEISTGLLERMVAGATDGGVVRYLLDNTALVVVPVHNVDGFLQTQRYPDRVIIGQDPTDPGSWPRDGRMRRKNMRGVDEVLETFGDHLGGIDLNRNHPPFWASSVGNGYSSNNPASLVYHGSGPHSELESQALVQALLLAPPDRLRMAVDIHSFTQVFYSSNTGRPRLNAIQSLLLTRVAAHHRVVSRPPGGFDGAIYSEVPDPAGGGGGLAAEYFAHEYLVPAWTLEIEPSGQLGGAQYGGTGQSHSGFILPASEVRRVREAWAESHVVAFYFMAGAPFLAELRIVDADTGVLVSQQGWQRSGASRQRSSGATGALQPGRRYRAELVFSKPMRVSVDGAAPGGFPGQGVVPAPTLALVGAGQDIALDAGAGNWLAQGKRYAYDTFVVEFDAPAAVGAYALRVETRDAVGHRLDADPSTPVDWVEGAWSGLEGAAGAGDEGGPDDTAVLQVEASDLALATAPAVLGEGDLGQIVLARSGGSGAVSARVRVAGVVAEAPLVCPFLEPSAVDWDAGEEGERSLFFCLDDDTAVQGPRSVEVVVETERGDGTWTAFTTFSVEILDNDVPGHSVVRASPDRLHGLLATLQPQPGQAVELVLDGGDYALPSGPSTACGQNVLHGPLTVIGNHARIGFADSAGCALLHAEGNGLVALHDLTLHGPEQLLRSEAPLLLQRVVLEESGETGAADTEGGALLANDTVGAPTTLRQSALHGLERGSPSAALLSGPLTAESSSFADLDAMALAQVREPAEVQVLGSTLLARSGGQALAMAGGALRTQGSLLQGAAGGVLCSGAGTVQSEGGNVASDASCGVAAGDQTPRTVPLQAVDALTGAPLPVGDAIDIGGECPPVDLRGAPRPQSMDGDETPLCDAGAIELGIHPYRGLWIPDRPGHGVDIHTVGNVLFLTWYTYHPDGSPAAYQAAAPLTGPVWRARLDSAQRLADGTIQVFEAGEIELDFASDILATLRWRIGEATEWGEEGLQAYFFAEGEPRVEATGTWYDASDSGWGLTVTRRGALSGLVLYYYDGEGTLRWALAQGGDGDVLDLTLLGFTGFCPDCDAAANPVQSAPVGTLQLQFFTPQRARVTLDAGYGGGARFQRQGAALTPLNDPVDNRRAAAEGDAKAAKAAAGTAARAAVPAVVKPDGRAAVPAAVKLDVRAAVAAAQGDAGAAAGL